MTNEVDHPTHYTSHPSGYECIDLVEHLPFNIGNAIKYLWRRKHKGRAHLNVDKARWYISRELGRKRSLYVSTCAPKIARDAANAFHYYEKNEAVANAVLSLFKAAISETKEESDTCLRMALHEIDNEIERLRKQRVFKQKSRDKLRQKVGKRIYKKRSRRVTAG